MPDEQLPVVVIGGGLAGGKTVEQLRENGYNGGLVLLTAEQHLPYERPPLSKSYLMGESPRDEVFVHDAAWYADHRVEVVLGDEVTSLEPVAHEVRTAS